MLLRPVDNPLEYKYNSHTIQFTEVHELVQGGPETGNLIIDNFKLDKKLRFGTNICFYDEYIIVPRYKWSWGLFKSGNFKLCLVSLREKKMIEFGKVETLIMPKDVRDKIVFYYTDLDNVNLSSVSIPI
jgi:hypothetical protein